ncbi:MAG: hypothetical protein GF417_09650 [Candidatus Latescibacteria bacterium]|nr:hypothetical protein [bacterium]MBD3424689.1 hypothetical protein [Candidatus Latescibacterota bacterium]
MRKMVVIFSVVLMVLSASMLIAGDEKKIHMNKCLPPAEGKPFIEYIMNVSPYHGWGDWPGHAGMKEGKSPHGKYIKLLANPIALKAVREGKEMPHGAIIMKENYNEKKELVALTPMYRVKGYNPEGGDWFWAKTGPDGKIMAEGKIKGCIDCHARVKKKDWVFHPPK